MWGGTGRRKEVSANFIDLIYIGDVHCLTKSEVKGKRQSNYRLQISNPQISIHILKHPDSRFLFVLVNSMSCVSELVLFSKLTTNIEKLACPWIMIQRWHLVLGSTSCSVGRK